MDPKQIHALILRHRIVYDNEAGLQRSLENIFQKAGVPFVREYKLGPRDIIDFVVMGGIGIEVKIKGSPTAVAAQLLRYAKYPEIGSLLLVTAKLSLGQLPETLLGKPLFVAGLWKSGL